MDSNGEQGKLTLRWIGWADDEYIAARKLLLTDALVQGSSLSNTAIEKYLKALFIASGQKFPKIHNICKLYEKIKSSGPQLNEEYLALLFKSYLLRYPDDLKPGFNILLGRTKLLVELDHTVYEIKKGISFEKAGKKITTRIENLQEKKDPVLLDKNCFFGNYDRVALFEESSPCYELRVLKQDVFVEAFLYRTRINDDGKFDVEALKPDGELTFKAGDLPNLGAKPRRELK